MITLREIMKIPERRGMRIMKQMLSNHVIPVDGVAIDTNDWQVNPITR